MAKLPSERSLERAGSERLVRLESWLDGEINQYESLVMGIPKSDPGHTAGYLEALRRVKEKLSK